LESTGTEKAVEKKKEKREEIEKKTSSRGRIGGFNTDYIGKMQWEQKRKEKSGGGTER